MAKSYLPRHNPRPWWIALALVGAALILVAYWVGDVTDHGTAAWGGKSFSWLKDFFGGAAGLLLGSNNNDNVPAGIRFLALALLLAFLSILWRAMLANAAYGPGPVAVKDLTDVSRSTEQPPETGELTTYFRQRLAETKLHPPVGTPSPPATSFLDLVGDMETDPKKLPFSIVRILSRIKPRVAYGVQGELRSRPQSPRCGITITITSYALGGCRMVTMWGDDWEEAVRKGADCVVASILPVTKSADQAPWQQWTGRDLPPELFSAYQQAKRYGSERKYDIALHYYYEALTYDPLNPYVRRDVTRVMLECGLYIDALDMIGSTIALDGREKSRYNQHLWDSAWSIRRLGYLWHLRRQPDAIDTRYGYMNIMGLNNETNDLATQWCEPAAPNDKRSSKRKEIRERLIPLLVERYWPMFYDTDDGYDGTWRHHSDEAEEAAKDIAREILNGNSAKKVRAFFMRACTQEACRLAADRGAAHLIPGVSAQRTWTGLRIYRDLAAPIGFGNALRRLSGEDRPSRHWDELPTWGWKSRTRAAAQRAVDYATGKEKRKENGKLISEQIEKETKKHLRFPHRPLPWPSRYWQDHYNAACVYAMSMRRWEAPREELRSKGRGAQKNYREANISADGAKIVVIQSPDARSSRSAAQASQPGPAVAENGETEVSLLAKEVSLLAKGAIEELEAAIRSAHSGYTTIATAKHVWMIKNDSDLDPLRNLAPDGFKALAGAVYPNPRILGSFPTNIVRRQLAAYDRQMLVHEARTMEQTWHWREGLPGTDVHGLIQWLRAEENVWEQLHELSDVRARDWPTRFELIDTVRNTAQDSHDSTDLRVPSIDDLGPASESYPDTLGDALESLSKELGGEEPSVIARTRSWIKELRAVDARGNARIPAEKVRDLCSSYAAAWQTIAEYLDFEERGKAATDQQLSSVLRSIPEPG